MIDRRGLDPIRNPSTRSTFDTQLSALCNYCRATGGALGSPDTIQNYSTLPSPLPSIVVMLVIHICKLRCGPTSFRFVPFCIGALIRRDASNCVRRATTRAYPSVLGDISLLVQYLYFGRRTFCRAYKCKVWHRFCTWVPVPMDARRLFLISVYIRR